MSLHGVVKNNKRTIKLTEISSVSMVKFIMRRSLRVLSKNVRRSSIHHTLKTVHKDLKTVTKNSVDSDGSSIVRAVYKDLTKNATPFVNPAVEFIRWYWSEPSIFNEDHESEWQDKERFENIWYKVVASSILMGVVGTTWIYIEADRKRRVPISVSDKALLNVVGGIGGLVLGVGHRIWIPIVVSGVTIYIVIKQVNGIYHYFDKK